MTKLNVVGDYLKTFHPSLHLALNIHRSHKNEPLSFIDLPYLIDIYTDNTPTKVIMKSTQSGITEWLIIYTIKETYYEHRNVFYVLPTDTLKSQFIRTRFDQSTQYTPFYQNLFQDAEYNNVSIKQIGNASIFFAVSNSRSNFTSFPADTLIIDELDECNLENIEMAPERLAFSKNPRIVKVANPSYPGLGIDYEYQKSDKKQWFLKCDKCGHQFTPDFFKNVVRQEREDEFIIMDKDFSFESKDDIRLICDKCLTPVYRYGLGEWIPELNRIVSGRQLNQLFTSRKTIRSIVEQFNEALPNEIKMQRFYNGTLGLPYLGAGACITDELFNSCISNYSFPDHCEDACVIGMDVGKVINTVIFHVIKNDYDYKLRLVYAGELNFSIVDQHIDISELVDLFRRYNIVSGMIDAMPEDRLARMISATFTQVFRCRYLSQNPKDHIDMERKIFETDRTMALDSIKESMTLGNILFPGNIDFVSKFRDQLKAPMRIFEEKEATNGKWVWREGNKADHYYHSCVYAQQALRLLSMLNQKRNDE